MFLHYFFCGIEFFTIFAIVINNTLKNKIMKTSTLPLQIVGLIGALAWLYSIFFMAETTDEFIASFIFFAIFAVIGGGAWFIQEIYAVTDIDEFIEKNVALNLEIRK